MYYKTILAGICSCVLFGAMASAQTSNLSQSDKTFLDMAADANMSEAYLGKMAENKASETSVKDFGQKMIRDHTDAYEALTILANKIGATIPKGIDVRRYRIVEELMHAKSGRFDRSFLREEVQDHEKALVEFRSEANHGQNVDVKAYASKMIPTLEQHLQIAQSLAKSERNRG
jgi:putative membrane protein